VFETGSMGGVNSRFPDPIAAASAGAENLAATKFVLSIHSKALFSVCAWKKTEKWTLD